MRAVIVAAGYGSRFLPVTRTIPKEMLPILDRPAIDFVVQELIEAGVDELLVITSRRKTVLDDWFDRQPELEVAFADAPAKLARIVPPDVRVTFVRQSTMQGTGHALLLARSFAGDQPIVVAFPDDLFVNGNCTAQLIEAHRATGCSVLCTQDFGEADVSRYGVIDPVERADGVIGVRRVVEKPAPGTEPSRLVSLGRYLYTPAIFAELERGLAAHQGGEFYPMDAIETLASRGQVVAVDVQARRLDTGKPLDYLKSVVEVALDDPAIGSEFQSWLQKRLQ